MIGQKVSESKRKAANAMRRAMTPAEFALWQRLRKNQVGGFHFRRQQIIDGFIADFYCHAAALVVEVDGASHYADADRERDAILAARRLRTIRFSNADVLSNIETVLAKIETALSQSQNNSMRLNAD